MVHTPTEAEAKELLRILHGCGYEWSDHKPLTGNTYWETYGEDTVYIACAGLVDKADMSAQKEWRGHNPVYTFAQFKEIFCAMTEQSTEIMNETSVTSDKPQPKFKMGDKVKISVPTSEFLNKYNGAITCVLERQMRGDGVEGWLTELSTAYVFKDEWLEPYTEPETKPTEDVETKGKELGKKGNNSENSQLNLCELLKGHEGERFYSPAFEDVKLINSRIEENRICIDTLSCFGRVQLMENGTVVGPGECILFPSRALYEQYPLDPYTAWMKWQEEQERSIHIKIVKVESDYTEIYQNLYFRTPADRDKCIEEIKAIIEKYCKK